MELYWIDDRLAVGPRPRADDRLEDDLDVLVGERVDVLVSCLTPGEERHRGCRPRNASRSTVEIRFERLPINDVEAPADVAVFDRVVRGLVTARAAGQRVVIHCKMGMGRAPLTAASVLVAEGRPSEQAWALIREKRGREVPDNESQHAWVADFEARTRP